jgi:SAM-dependent methyltransferase
MTDAAHQSLIRDQFTRQATPFSTAAPIANEAALQMIVDAARPGPDDTVLDVACGGGIVVCAFAPYLRHPTGIDVTPAMLQRARALAAEKHLANITWQEGGGRAPALSRRRLHDRRDPLRDAPLPQSGGGVPRDGAGLLAGWPDRRRRYLCRRGPGQGRRVQPP